MKQRYLLCLLLCGVMLYYQVPRLALNGEGLISVYSGMWLILALCAAAGNLSGILYSPKKRKTAAGKKGQSYKRMHDYQ
ncbi:hypothetical protein JOC77_002312 [Peribacillus deserti]|uniref:Uncharacterized protein n=1 Tax=Peribacillus deserti TaxID=673318 RepID=A0ABS2QI77_9BACI|nr:hypothetical protein [Peribacillus deserti]MBM7692881.1 hypothetical protein [Peribacillus deserti]